MTMIEPKVHIIYKNQSKNRRGRGFSRGELEAAGITVKESLWMGLPVDTMRKSVREDNIESLRTIMEQIENAPEPVEEAPRPKKEAKPKAEKPKKEKATPAPKKEGTPLEEIAGVGPKTAERLREAGYSSAEDIAKADVDALAEIKGISKKSATELIDNAKGL
jgi:ERCC4-type nuclease